MVPGPPSHPPTELTPLPITPVRRRTISSGRTFRAFQNHNFRLFFPGQLISQCGTWFQTTAQAWLVLSLTDSPVALGVIVALQMLPVLFLSLFGGVLADRVPRRKFLFFILLGETAQAAALAILTLTGQITVWEIGVLALVLGTCFAFEVPTRQALISDLVDRDQLQSAVSLNSTINNTARIIGPGLSGIIIAVFGTGICFAFNALSFLGSLTALMLMRADQIHETRRSPRGAVLTQLVDGLRYAATTPALIFPLVLLGFVGTFGYNFQVTLPLLAKFALGTGSVGFGGLNSALGVGALFGALGVVALVRPSHHTVLISAAGFSVLFFLLAVSEWYPISIAVLVFLGVMNVLYSTLTNTLLQLQSAEEYRGRVISVYVLLFAGTTPIGSALTGALVDAWGVHVALGLEAGVCVAASLGGWLYLRRRGSLAAAAGR